MTGGERDGEWTQVFLASLSSGGPKGRRGNSDEVAGICWRHLRSLEVKASYV